MMLVMAGLPTGSSLVHIAPREQVRGACPVLAPRHLRAGTWTLGPGCGLLNSEAGVRRDDPNVALPLTDGESTALCPLP